MRRVRPSDAAQVPHSSYRGIEVRMYEMTEHIMKVLMSIIAALSLGSVMFLVAAL
jgi:hypothetical protein